MELNFSPVRYQLNVKIVATDDKMRDKLTNYYKSFTNHHQGDSGIDLYSFESIYMSNSENHPNTDTIDFQIQCEMIDLKYNELVSYILMPRSSISKTPFMMRNGIGLIDSGYRGNITSKIIYNDVRTLSSDSATSNFENFVIEYDKLFLKKLLGGTKLPEGRWFQIVAPNNRPIKVNVLNDDQTLTTTTRGEGGFGSTG